MTGRAAVVALISALLFVAAAGADTLDPKVHLATADEASAKASLLRFSDLGSAWSGGAVRPQSLKIPLCPAGHPNDSDLVITGHAESILALASQGLQVDTDVEILPVVAVGSRRALYRVALSVATGGRRVEVDSDYLFLTKDRTAFVVNVIAPGDLAGQLAAFANHIATTLAARGT